MRIRRILVLMVLPMLASCGDRGHFERSGSAPGKNQSAAVQDQITAMALQRILRYVDSADIRVNPAKICVAQSAEFAKFDAASTAVIEVLKTVDPRIVPASECATQQEEWGRVVYRPHSQPSILIAARPYIFDEDNRAFVLGSWYVNTMRAQRFVFVFRRQNGRWMLDDGSKLGVV